MSQKNVLRLHSLPGEATELRHSEYEAAVRQGGGDWQPLDVYTVKSDLSEGQNMSDEDPVVNSPMVSFDFSGTVDVRIRRITAPIESVEIHPSSLKLRAHMEGEYAVIRLKEPRQIALALDGDRQNMAYILANSLEEDAPDPTDDSVIRLGPGVHTFPESGHSVLKGGIADAAIYSRALSTDELAEYAQGMFPASPAACWPLSEDFGETIAGRDGHAVKTAAIDTVAGRKALSLNGYDDALSTDYRLETGESSYTLCARVWLDPARPDTGNPIFGGLLATRSDGRLYTNLGGWEYPLVSEEAVPFGRWTDVALVKENLTLTFYIDGHAVGSGERTFTKTNASVLLGAGGIANCLCLRDGQTLWLDPGAIVTGSVYAYGVKDAAVRGRGILYRSPGQSVLAMYARDFTIEGVTILDPRSMCIHLCESDGVAVRGVKAFSRLGATDGVHMKASSNVTIDGCFLRTNDDCIAVYASFMYFTGNAENITARNCVLINDAAHAIFSGIHAAAGGQDLIQNLLFENIDVVDSFCSMSDYQGVLALNAANDVTIDTVIFRNLRIEDFRLNQLFNLRVWNNPDYCKSSGRAIRHVRFESISYTGENAVTSVIHGDSEQRRVEDVVFDHLTVNGRQKTTLENGFLIGNFTDKIQIR